MELINPFILVIGIPLIGFLIFKNMKKDSSYENGKKVANTHFVKDSPYYKEILTRYKRLTLIIKSICIIAIFMSLVLLARPAKVDIKSNPIHARDIFLCMDASASVDELNIELVKCLKNTVNSLKEERFGISIFNTSSVLLAPLTDDYDFINSELDELEKSFDFNINFEDYDSSKWKTQQYITAGTLVGVNTRGSSLIGDGLGSCVYNFTNLEDKDRTRIIIFSTDNDLAGDEIITLQEAAALCKENNILVYGIAPDFISTKNEADLKKAVEVTGGKYYTLQEGQTVKEIVSDIEKTTKSLIEGQVETRVIDQPLIPFLIIVISISGLLILDKKVNI